jgi:hypothetical protein
MGEREQQQNGSEVEYPGCSEEGGDKEGKDKDVGRDGDN